MVGQKKSKQKGLRQVGPNRATRLARPVRGEESMNRHGSNPNATGNKTRGMPRDQRELGIMIEQTTLFLETPKRREGVPDGGSPELPPPGTRVDPGLEG